MELTPHESRRSWPSHGVSGSDAGAARIALNIASPYVELAPERASWRVWEDVHAALLPKAVTFYKFELAAT